MDSQDARAILNEIRRVMQKLDLLEFKVQQIEAAVKTIADRQQTGKQGSRS